MLTKNKGSNPPAPRAAPEFVAFDIDLLSVKSSKISNSHGTIRAWHARSLEKGKWLMHAITSSNQNSSLIT
jgi:hypothetical protein